MAVFDSKAESYLPPFFTQTRGTGVRDFSQAAGTSDHQFHRHASDYTLFELGSFDCFTGVFEPHEAAVPLGTALQFVGEA